MMERGEYAMIQLFPNFNIPGFLQRRSGHIQQIDLHGVEYQQHAARIAEELQALGVTRSGQGTDEARYLPRLIHLDEHIDGVVYGRQQAGKVMLISTDRRIIFIDKKPLFLRDDEIGFGSVRGVTYFHKLFTSTVILHTQVQDYSVSTLNSFCAQTFIRAIERHSLEYRGI